MENVRWASSTGNGLGQVRTLSSFGTGFEWGLEKFTTVPGTTDQEFIRP